MREQRLGVRIVTLALLGLAGASSLALAQSDTAGLHATLHAWADETWFLLLDRDAARDGRFSRQGILQRFQSTVDPDYQINMIRIRFGMLDDYDWYGRTRGARCDAGSLSTTEFAEGCEFKVAVPLSGSWSAGLHFNRADLPTETRSLTRLGFTRTGTAGTFFSVETTIVPYKPSTALEVGAGWRRPGREWAVFVGDLGVLTNFIFGSLGVEGTAASDTALHYERQPFTLRLNVDQFIGTAWRFESRGGVLLPSAIRAYRRFFPDSGFRQAEEYAFASVLLERRLGSRLSVSGFATYVRAVIDRNPLPAGRALDDFRVMEREAQGGALVLARLSPQWTAAGWVGRNWRPQSKQFRTGTAPNVDYEDVAWSGQVTLEHRPERGMGESVVWDWDLRDVLRGAGELPGNVEAPRGRHNNEIRFEVGWRATARYAFTLGLAVDTDPGVYPRGWFGGGEGRFALYW